jgi:hypothetical protein
MENKSKAQVNSTINGYEWIITVTMHGKLSEVRKFKIEDYALRFRNATLGHLCEDFDEVTGNEFPRLAPMEV